MSDKELVSRYASLIHRTNAEKKVVEIALKERGIFDTMQTVYSEYFIWYNIIFVLNWLLEI